MASKDSGDKHMIAHERQRAGDPVDSAPDKGISSPESSTLIEALAPVLASSVGPFGVNNPLDPISLVDPRYVRAQLDYTTILGTRDPLCTVTSAVEMGSVIASFLSSPSAVTSSPATSLINLDNTISALSELNRPYNQLVNAPSFEPYLNSMTSLASVSGMASTVKALGTLVSADILFPANKPADLGLTASGLGIHATLISSLSTSALTQVLAPTMLASTKAVLGIDSAYARLGETDFPISAIGNAPVFQVPSYVTNLHEGLSTLTRAAKTTWDVVALRPDVLSTTTLYSALSPGVEIYTASQAAGVISLPANKFPEVDRDIEEIIDTTVDGLEARLSSLSPSLSEMYRGAIITIERGGPDWRRQSMVSFRELTSHLMHILAPDERVKPWAKPEHFDKGRLTRRARLEYIFEPVAGGEFTDFFKADFKVAIELFGLLNDGTHRLASTATPHQLRYLRGRVANFVSAMLEAREH